MIKFERRETTKSRKAIEVLKKAKKSDSGYNTPEVNEALSEMFYGKCYICENRDGITSFQIEHLNPHRSDPELKYDWMNLFWACAHCNNIKNDQYEPILDCSKVDVERRIAFRKSGYFGMDESYEFVVLDEELSTKNTAALLHAAYYGTTVQKRMEAVNLRRSLRDELTKFKNLVRDYEESEDYRKEDLLLAIRQEISAKSQFTAFKRWILWDHQDRYSELIRLCNI